MDRPGLADFLRRRREALQPSDVGLPRGSRRRTAGLRREEVAALAGMSPDYYGRLEQQRGPQPSEQMAAAIARALRLTLDERDHLFRLVGLGAPDRSMRSDHVAPALLRVLDRLDDTPAMVVSDLSETLVQNPLAEALVGVCTGFRGLNRYGVYRWFMDPASQQLYPSPERELFGRQQVSTLRTVLTRGGSDVRAQALRDALLAGSPAFRAVWELHEVGIAPSKHKRLCHPELGLVELDCQMLFTENQAQALLVFTATPGTPDYDTLALLRVVGSTR